MSPPQQETFNSGNKQSPLILLCLQWAVLMLDLQNHTACAIEMKVFVEPAGKVQWKWSSDTITVISFHHFRVVKSFCRLKFQHPSVQGCLCS